MYLSNNSVTDTNYIECGSHTFHNFAACCSNTHQGGSASWGELGYLSLVVWDLRTGGIAGGAGRGGANQSSSSVRSCWRKILKYLDWRVLESVFSLFVIRVVAAQCYSLIYYSSIPWLKHLGIPIHCVTLHCVHSVYVVVWVSLCVHKSLYWTLWWCQWRPLCTHAHTHHTHNDMLN